MGQGWVSLIENQTMALFFHAVTGLGDEIWETFAAQLDEEDAIRVAMKAGIEEQKQEAATDAMIKEIIKEESKPQWAESVNGKHK